MDQVNHPPHYTQGSIECVDAMLSAFGEEHLRIYCRLNAFKYLWRSAEHKDGEQINLKKAIWYLHRCIGDDPREKLK